MAVEKPSTRTERTREVIERLGRASDAQLVAAAKKRLLAKQSPTRPQLAAWKRHVDEMDTAERNALLAGVPHKLLCQMAGDRSSKQINDMQDRYGLPTRGATVSIPDFVRGVFDWFAVNGRKVRRITIDDENDVGGENSPALERLRAAKARREEFAYERDLDQWIRREAVHEALTIMSGLIRGAGERLLRNHGRDAHAILDEALVAAGKLLQRRFGENAKAPSNNKAGPKKTKLHNAATSDTK